MNTVTINNSLYNSTEQYARRHKMTVEQVVETGLKLLFNQFHTKQNMAGSVWETDKYKNALAYLDTLADGCGTPIPADEDGRDARTRKYSL